jgi:hypothetical protein
MLQPGWGGGASTGLNLRVSPHHGLQLLALAVMLAPPLNNAQEFGMSNQKRHEFVTLATLYRLTVMIEGARHHLDGIVKLTTRAIKQRD